MRNDPEIAAHLGEVLWVMGDRQAAKDIWDTALKDTPADDRYYWMSSNDLNRDSTITIDTGSFSARLHVVLRQGLLQT